MAVVHAALEGHGTIDVVLDVHQLLAELAFPRDECVVLDPALISPAAAENVVMCLSEFPRSVVAYSSVTTSALESAIILAQGTAARFVFRGTPNERSALQRALLLTPNSELASALLTALTPYIDRLPRSLRERIASMLRSGDGPASSDALAAASNITRRSLDRRIPDAGLVSARAIIEAAHVAWAYRSITASTVPLTRIAAMLGYTSSRTMDQQLQRLMDITSSKLREQPLPIAEATSRLMQHLMLPDVSQEDVANGRSSEDVKASLKVISGGARSRRGSRIISTETGVNP